MLRSLIGLALLSTTVFACTAGFDETEPDRSEDEVRKRVKPKAGEGLLQIVKPSWVTPSFSNAFTLDGLFPMKLGDSISKPPGTYRLEMGTTINAYGSLSRMVDVQVGATTVVNPGGLRVRYDKPVTFGNDTISIALYFQGRPNPFGQPEYFGSDSASWRNSSDGVQTLVFARRDYMVTTPDFSWTGTVDEGKLVDVVMPTAALVVTVDTIDSAYPDAVENSCLSIRNVRSRRRESAEILTPRQLARAPVTVPADVAASSIELWVSNDVGPGVSKWKATAGSTVTIALNRLEVDDVEVTSANGTTSVPGSYTLEVLDMQGNARWWPCAGRNTYRTHTGLDLPNGRYRITSTAQTATGVVSQVEEVSFP